MTEEVQQHYDTLLAAHYEWIIGLPFANKVAEQRALLSDLGVAAPGLAVDLGCGPGYQACALSDLGARTVLALDTSRRLIEALDAAKGERNIRSILADLRGFAHFVDPASADVIVCMGDTLTHLENTGDVNRLCCDAYDRLAANGLFVLTFRDLSEPVTGLDRFIPIRADDDRVFMCALDYVGDRVLVTDLIQVRTPDGWVLHKSSYTKLRLKPSDVEAELKGVGFTIEQNRRCGGLHALVARKKSRR